MYVVGVDIGGTFTDCVLVSEDGAIVTGKAPSTPHDPVEGFLNSIAQAGHRLAGGNGGGNGGASADILEQASLVLHGTTVGTNIMVERKGARVGLLATQGHGDALLIMRGSGRTKGLPAQQLLDVVSADKPDPVIPRSLIREVSERVDVNGDVVVPLDEEQAGAAIDELLAAGCEAIAIALLWSFKNPAHEQRLVEMIAERSPDVFVTASSDLLPKRGEYERTAGSAINAYLGPKAARYLRATQTRLASAGYREDLLIMQCAGGVISVEDAATAPILTLASGPVGGVVGSNFLGDLRGEKNIITTDMGGTTFDVAVIRDGAPVARETSIIDQYEYLVPMVDITSIGAGGGSIIAPDPRSGGLKVGPESAGADPGPVAYGRGGTRATVTDADLVLGRLNPATFLGGRLDLDAAASERALADAGEPLRLTAEQTAAGAVAIVERNMAEAIRQVTIQKGYDPRDFVLFAYGGAGPTHAAGYARELGAKAVVVPLGEAASAWSALGVATSDLLHVHESMAGLVAPFAGDDLTAGFAALQEEARRQLLDEGVAEDRITFRRSVTMRYRLQLHTVEVPIEAAAFDDAAAAELVDAFHVRYEDLYGEGAGFRGAGVELVGFKLVAVGTVSHPAIAGAEVSERVAATPGGSRDVYWYEITSRVPTSVYDGDELRPGHTLTGPAIIELPDTTVAVPPGTAAEVDGYGNIVMTTGED
jgi:N-methylhydantoinase A